jgi:polysaccharide transporter, PST family
MFAILQGLGYTFIPALSVLIGVGVKYFVNINLIPEYGVIGAAVSTVLSYGIVALLTILYLVRKGYSFKDYKSLAKVGISILLMVLVLTVLLIIIGLFINLDNRIYATFAAFIGVLIGSGFYGWTILKFNVFSRDELQYIPILNKLIK